jgi:hypothetical protein
VAAVPSGRLDRPARSLHLTPGGGSQAGFLALARWLIILGVVLIVAGLLWPWLTRLGLGRLPGEIVIEREGFRLYIPLATSLLISLVLSLILWLLNR